MECILAILILNLIVLITGSHGDEMPSIGSLSFKENPKRISLALKKKRETNEASWLESLPSARSCGRPSKTTPLIIGRKEVTQGEYPWMVALYHYKGRSVQHVAWCYPDLRHVCYHSFSAAAHCTKDQARVLLEFGRQNIGDIFEEQYLSRTSIKIIQNPEYVDSAHGDVSLISFEPVIFSQWIKPICLWGNFDTKLRWGIVAGWGRETNDGALSTTPIQLNVSMVGLDECRNSDERLRTVATNKTFCAGGRGIGPCHGHNGGGYYVVHNNIWYLRGIVSTSIGTQYTCNFDKYSVYVDLAYFLDWIRSYLLP